MTFKTKKKIKFFGNVIIIVDIDDGKNDE